MTMMCTVFVVINFLQLFFLRLGLDFICGLNYAFAVVLMSLLVRLSETIRNVTFFCENAVV